MFNHIPANQIQTTQGLFDDYQNGSFGLLPEGEYEVQMTAYRWANPKLEVPVVVSNPVGGKAYFTVCYKAQAPQFLMPMTAGVLVGSGDVADLDALNPMFSWTAPVLACNAGATQYRYDFKVVEVLEKQSPAEAIEKNPVVYQAKSLTVPQCIIPQNILSSQFYLDRTYAAQVVASSASGNAMNYVMVENEGKSNFRLFRIVTSDMKAQPKEEPKADDNSGNKGDNGDSKGDVKGDNGGEKSGDGNGDKADDKKSDDKKDDGKGGDDDKDDEDDATLTIMGDKLEGAISKDSLYTYKYPNIQSPHFEASDGARKMFVGQDMKVEWIASTFMGGEGPEEGRPELAYDVEIFVGGTIADLEGTLATDPIYRKRTTELEDSIPWEDIKDAVETGNYMVLRVNPVVTKGSSVAFSGEKKHIRDFALAELLTKKYFQCSSMVDITNTNPTTKKASEYKGQTIPIGQYQLTIDEIKDGKTAGTFEGKGHVKWEPFGFEIGVCVKFSALKINTDDVVIEGLAESYSQEEGLSDIQVVDKLFSDWGIDNLIGDSGIPYASEISDVAKNKAKDLAKQINLSKYYGYVKKGQAIYNDLLSGKINDLYMPLSIPKDINTSPVDIQIVSMKFAPTYATMDILGQFTLPNTKYTANDILVLGAPRICISPDRLLPESGTVALLSDFTIKDPKSSYEMTFKAPKNVIEPEDGCFVSWHADKFEMLGLDLDMKIPGLVKDKNGNPTEEQPVFNAKTTIADWDDWMVELNIDPFQVKALPGWTFTASNIVYDHSLYNNYSSMGAFPKTYDVKKAGITGVVIDGEGKQYNVDGNKDWQGLYIKEIGIKFPKALEFGEETDKRLNISAKNMFFDKSGATLELAGDNILSAKTGKAGGWSFSLDKVNLSFIQSSFHNCGFSGKFGVPLLDTEIGYDCRIMNLTKDTDKEGQYAYVFKTQQINESLDLDFFLATASIKKEQTYFLLESLPDGKGGQDTSCELLLGGTISLGGKNYKETHKDKKLALNIDLPGIHFARMRIANKPFEWESQFESSLQKGAKEAAVKGMKLYEGKDIKFGSNCYFNVGSWSLASEEKKVGGFSFALEEWDVSNQNNELGLYVKGRVNFVSDIELGASCGLTIYCNPQNMTDLKNFKLNYKRTEFNSLDINAAFAGMTLKGGLKCGDSENEGFGGSLTFTMPGDLFSVDASGGYFQYKPNTAESFSYGWFYAAAGSKSGIQAPPIAINKIEAGFYFNCKRNEDKATPQRGLIGVIAGLTLSTTAGEDALKADVDMTVVYDKDRKRLSSFIFTGNVEAVSGLVSAKCNLVYEHNDNDKYLQVDLNIDATADSETVIKKFGGDAVQNLEKSLADAKKELNSKYEGLKKLVPQAGLEKLSDEQSKPDESKVKEDKVPKFECGAKIDLLVKVIWKEKGTTYSKPHWSVCVGQPDIDKRCKFTYLKFKSSVVSVDIGANAYLCLGNVLPNNGKLPEIPSQVANFLNGSDNGNGIENASLAEVERGRKASLDRFEQESEKNGGGIMLGAQAYGYFNVDLGLFYLDAGVTAGFDISLVKDINVICTNIEGNPGYKGWYGRGQLYAYLYANLGVRIDLGFWKDDFPVFDAGIGGMFQMQGPKPTHFEGKARVKLRLLGGLVNIDRRFAFECGQGCDAFYGNALDDFKLFGDLSIGYSDMKQGLSKNNAINPKLLQRPYFTTEAPLDEPFRVVDPTDLAKLQANFTGDPAKMADLEMEACRTFIFRSNVGSKVTLYEYPSPRMTGTPEIREFAIKGKDRFCNYIDLFELTPNRYYKMTVSGYAKEIIQGMEKDPVKFDTLKNSHYNEEWKQRKTYYFCTGDAEEISDNPDNLQDYVAIAYPSYKNQIVSDQEIQAYVHDIQCPTIAFFSDISGKVFQKGKLKWVLRDHYSKKMMTESPAKWVVMSNPHVCNLTVEKPLKVFEDHMYDLCLIYTVPETKFEYRGRKLVGTSVDYHDYVVASMTVNSRKGDWRIGSSWKVTYDKPFLGSRIVDVKYSKSRTHYSDYDIAMGNTDLPYRNLDAYSYISYLSNYVFIGGWQFSADRLDANITTAQSCIYTDKGGVYEGKLGTGTSYNIYNDWKKIRDLSTYTEEQYGAFTKYPLPFYENSEGYGYALSGLPRAAKYNQSTSYKERVQDYITDLYTPFQLCRQISNKIYEVINWFDLNVNYKYKGQDSSYDKDAVQNWYAERRGQMVGAGIASSSIQIPCYQFPIIWGSCLPNNKSWKNVTAWGTIEGYSDADKSNPEARGHAEMSCWLYSSMYGKNNFLRNDGYTFCKENDNMTERIEFNLVANTDLLKSISSVDFECYRVNSYDIDKCAYTINDKVGVMASDRFTLEEPLTYVGGYTYKVTGEDKDHPLTTPLVISDKLCTELSQEWLDYCASRPSTSLGSVSSGSSNHHIDEVRNDLNRIITPGTLTPVGGSSRPIDLPFASDGGIQLEPEKVVLQSDDRKVISQPTEGKVFAPALQEEKTTTTVEPAKRVETTTTPTISSGAIQKAGATKVMQTIGTSVSTGSTSTSSSTGSTSTSSSTGSSSSTGTSSSTSSSNSTSGTLQRVTTTTSTTKRIMR